MPDTQYVIVPNLQVQRYGQLSTRRHSRDSPSLVSGGSSTIKQDEDSSVQRKDGYAAVMHSASALTQACSALLHMV